MASHVPRTRVAVTAADSISASALYALLSGRDELDAVYLIEMGESTDSAIYDVDVLLADLGWSSNMEALNDGALPLPDQGRIDGLPVVALVADESHAAAAWRAGYRSLLLRTESPQSLAYSLCAAAEGVVTLSARLSTSLPIGRNSGELADVEQLTDREQEVLYLVAEGLTNRAIAQRLEISEHTVKFHVNSILGKLGAESRTDAVVRATRAGLMVL
jgi:two-component system nitrate/nitrite response regulator NarL